MKQVMVSIFLAMLLMVSPLATAAFFKDSLMEGGSHTYIVDGDSYEVKLSMVSNPAEGEATARFTVNGDALTIDEDEDKTFPSGVLIRVQDILEKDDGRDYVEYYFSLPGTLEDVDPTTEPERSYLIEVDDDETPRLIIRENDDGLGEAFVLSPQGDDTYILEVTNHNSQTYRVPYLEALSNELIAIGEDEGQNALWFHEGDASSRGRCSATGISQNEYFVISDAAEGSEAQSAIMRFEDFDTSSQRIQIEDKSNEGEQQFIVVRGRSELTDDKWDKLGGFSLPGPSGEGFEVMVCDVDNANSKILVDLNGDGEMEYERKVPFTIRGGGMVDLGDVASWEENKYGVTDDLVMSIEGPLDDEQISWDINWEPGQELSLSNLEQLPLEVEEEEEEEEQEEEVNETEDVESPLDLSYYPDVIRNEGSFEGRVVVGEHAPSDDVLSAIDIVGSLVVKNPGDAMPVGVAVLDKNIDLDEATTVSVGSPCVNTYTMRALREEYDDSSLSCEDIELEKGAVILLETGDHRSILATGDDSEQTSWAAEALMEHEEAGMNGRYCSVEKDDGQLIVSCRDEIPHLIVEEDESCPVADRTQDVRNGGNAKLEPDVKHDMVIEDGQGREITTIEAEWDGAILESDPEKYPVRFNGDRVLLTRGKRMTVELDDEYELRVAASDISGCDQLLLTMRVDRIDEDGPPSFPDDDYVDYTKVRISLDKGWNLITLPGELEVFVPTGDKKLLGYVWIAEEKEYFSLKDAKEELGSGFNQYLATHAFWVYAYKDQELVAYVDEFTVDDLDVERGWNLLPVITPFVGESLKTLDGACGLSTAYMFNSDRQRWEKWSITKEFTRSHIGEGFLLRSSESCSLEGGVLAPPSLPGFPDDDADYEHDDDDYDDDDDRDDEKKAKKSKSKGRVKVDWVPPGLAKQGRTLPWQSDASNDSVEAAQEIIRMLREGNTLGAKIKINGDDVEIEWEEE